MAREREENSKERNEVITSFFPLKQKLRDFNKDHQTVSKLKSMSGMTTSAILSLTRNPI